MSFNGHAKRIAGEAVADIKSRATISWKGFTTAAVVLAFLGLFWRGAIFYAQTTADSVTVKRLDKKIKELQIEKTVGDSSALDYFQFIVKKLEPDEEKAKAFIKEMEEKKEKLIKKLIEDLENEK